MNRLIEKLTFAPDLTRGLRGGIAFSVALLICFQLGVPVAAQFVATTALNLSLVQLRGAYHIRGAVLGGMLLVLTGAAFLGASTAGNTAAAVAGIGGLALLSGWWRQISPNYGTPLSIGSALLFLLALEGPSHGATPAQVAEWTALGGAGAAILHLGLWLFRPEHALRHSVAEAWVAASDLFLALRPTPHGEVSTERHLKQHRALRETLDRTTAALAAADSKARAPLISHLNHMRHEAAHFSMQVVAFQDAVEPLLSTPEFSRHGPVLDSLMTEFANLARAIAVALVSRRREHLGIAEARAQTCDRFIQLLCEQLSALGNTHSPAPHALRLLQAIRTELLSIREALAGTREPATTARLPFFALSEADERSIRRLAGGLHTARLTPDPVLMRYSLRMAVLSMLVVAAYMAFNIPHGNWMALAIIVVLQPDYGSTRQRAFQRVGGTFAGGLLGGAIAASPVPQWSLGALAGGMAFGFAYFLRRSYATAVFFVTVMLVLITGLHMPVHLDFAISRLLSNLIGATVALVAALYFWPSWEREKLPDLLSKAIRANHDYFAAVARQLARGEGFSREVIHAKQNAERAGSIAAASLQRMQAEPARERKNEAQLGALLTSNQRITSAISVFATHLSETSSSLSPENKQTAGAVLHALDQLAGAPPIESPHPGESQLVGELASTECNHPVSWSLEKVSAEVRAMFLTAHMEDQGHPSQVSIP